MCSFCAIIIKRSKILQLIDARTRNLNASVYILSINWYIRSDCEMWQHIVTAEGVGACYRRKVQQCSLRLIYTYGTRFFKWRKNEGGSKILNWGGGTLRFRVLLCCVNELGVFFGRLIQSAAITFMFIQSMNVRIQKYIHYQWKGK